MLFEIRVRFGLWFMEWDHLNLKFTVQERRGRWNENEQEIEQSFLLEGRSSYLPWRYSYSILTFTYIPFDIYSLKDSKEDFQLNYLNFRSTNILLYLAINFHEKKACFLYNFYNHHNVQSRYVQTTYRKLKIYDLYCTDTMDASL